MNLFEVGDHVVIRAPLFLKGGRYSSSGLYWNPLMNEFIGAHVVISIAREYDRYQVREYETGKLLDDWVWCGEWFEKYSDSEAFKAAPVSSVKSLFGLA